MSGSLEKVAIPKDMLASANVYNCCPKKFVLNEYLQLLL